MEFSSNLRRDFKRELLADARMSGDFGNIGKGVIIVCIVSGHQP
jgi:hypothetical protein